MTVLVPLCGTRALANGSLTPQPVATPCLA